MAEQRSKLPDIFWHLRWLGDLIEADAADDRVRFLDFCRAHLCESSAQAFQDLFVLYSSGRRRGGYFVEFGASDGISMNNTFLLERQYDWSGILAEPAKIWHNRLKANRRCHVDFRCVFDKTGESVPFREVETGEISSIESVSELDGLGEARRNGLVYDVDTVTLHDLLSFYRAPRAIDYISIDTEGAELSILSGFDFSAYDVRLITVEHNYIQKSRDGIHKLLTAKGFLRKFEEFSGFDDWYVNGGGPFPCAGAWCAQ